MAAWKTKLSKPKQGLFLFLFMVLGFFVFFFSLREGRWKKLFNLAKNKDATKT